MDVIEKPMSLLKSISNIESGRVYAIVPRKTQNAQVFNQNKNSEQKFLFYIQTQQVQINDELFKLALFKDITWGVLYE